MPSAGFKAQLAPLVITGEKLTTVRKGTRWKKGDRIVAYYGLRFIDPAVLLMESTVREADPLTIHLEVIAGRTYAVIKVCDQPLSAAAQDALARGDGFSNIVDFILFFVKEHTLPFSGQIVQWEHPHLDPNTITARLMLLRDALRNA